MRARLVERAQQGDDVAFGELVDLDGDLCYAIAYRILRDAEQARTPFSRRSSSRGGRSRGCATPSGSGRGSVESS